jgi:hypothetical protein
VYLALLQQMQKTLQNLDAVLEYAVGWANERSFPADNFMQLRLAPDMLPFGRQVTIMCDVAKAAGAAWAGVEAPKFADDETTVAQLRDRITRTQAFLATLDPAAVSACTDDRVVNVPFPPGSKMTARNAALSRSLPNFFFHASMTYAILRAGGVPLGKRHFLGELNYLEA